MKRMQLPRNHLLSQPKKRQRKKIIMPAPTTLALFLIAALGLFIVPGPAVLYVVTRSIDQGRKAGLVSVLGIGTGTIFHVAAAALGISVLLVTSALALTVVKYIGAAYLIYLGLRTLFKRENSQELGIVQPRKLSQIFFQGIIVNVFNPKTALFFFAFLPQFVDPARGSVPLQILFLGGLFVLLGMCSDSLYAILAGTAGQWLKGNARFRRIQRYATGSVYIGLGIAAALVNVEKK
jgi:threonine/homoserine/homoserine lactone efflux protein